MKPKDVDKYAFLKFAANCVLVFFTLVVLSVFYLVVIEANPPVKIMSDIVIVPQVASSGDVVIMTTSYCKYTDADSNLSTFWQREDGLIWELKVRNASISEKGCDTVSVPLVIPEGIPEGRWQRVNIGSYQVNVLMTRTETWKSDFIEIAER